MEERYIRNLPALSEADMETLKNARVAVIGLGGLGGYVVEFLARTGVGTIIAADGDTFSGSNLNRQLLATSETLGQSKARAAFDRVQLVNPLVQLIPYEGFFSAEDAPAILKDADLIVDALDNSAARLALEDAAAEFNIPIIHGAIEGWHLQVMIVPPGSGLLHMLYGERAQQKGGTSLAMTAAACGAMEASAAVQVLCGKKDDALPAGTLISMSMKDMGTDLLPFLV